MDATALTEKLDSLEGNIDELEEALGPLLQDLGAASSHLPLLDKAKLSILSTYALETLLFCSLRLNGVETRNHAIFQELTRVKQYFEKVRKIEEPPEKPTSTLDTQAAIRFVRADLADNPQIKEGLSEMLVKEMAKAEGIAISKKRRNEPAAPEASSDAKGSDADGQVSGTKKPRTGPRSRGRKLQQQAND